MADPADTIAKLICCPMFDGQVESFLTWYMRFETFAGNNGFEKAMTIATDPPMPVGQDVPLSTDQQIADEEEAAKKENKDAYAYLLACLLSARDLRYVRKARIAAWPEGLACHVIGCVLITQTHKAQTQTRVLITRNITHCLCFVFFFNFFVGPPPPPTKYFAYTNTNTNVINTCRSVDHIMSST
jgi:hypothetical protein